MTDTLASALVSFQTQAPIIPRDKTVRVATKAGGQYTFNYAPLEAIIHAIQPVLAANGLAFSQPLDSIDGKPAIRTMLFHTSGESIASVFPLPLTGQEDAQGIGSMVTYCRRYALISLLGLATEEDDDGNAASGNQAQAQPRYTTGAATADAPIRAATGADTSMEFKFSRYKGRTLQDVWDDPTPDEKKGTPHGGRSFINWVAWNMDDPDPAYPDRVAFRDAARALCQADTPFGSDPDSDVPF